MRSGQILGNKETEEERKGREQVEAFEKLKEALGR